MWASNGKLRLANKDDVHTLFPQSIDDVERLQHVSSQPAEFRNDQRVITGEPREQFIDAALFGIFARRNFYLDELIDEARRANTLDSRPLQFVLEKDRRLDGVLSFPGKVEADDL